MSTAPTFEELFDPEFLAAVSRWSFAGRRVSSAGRHGARLSPDRGGGIEFKDYRPYSPGDDLRAIDWNLYRRLGKVFIRLFEEEQNLPVYLLPDVSGSMFHSDGQPPALHAGLRCTLALASVALDHHDTVGLFPFGEELQVLFRATSGHAQIMSVARQLAQLAATPPTHGTRLTHALRRLGHLGLRRGLLIVISDFFDPAGIDGLREAFKTVRHRVMLIQLTRPTDAEPVLTGEVRLTDCESGETLDLSVTPAVLARYRAEYLKFNDGLAALARRQGGRRLAVDVSRPLLPQLAALLTTGDLRA